MRHVSIGAISPYTPLVPHICVGEPGHQVMTCYLFGAKPLPEPMLAYCQLDSWEQISVKFESEFYHFQSRKFISKCRLPKWQPFFPEEMSYLTQAGDAYNQPNAEESHCVVDSILVTDFTIRFGEVLQETNRTMMTSRMETLSTLLAVRAGKPPVTRTYVLTHWGRVTYMRR